MPQRGQGRPARAATFRVGRRPSNAARISAAADSRAPRSSTSLSWASGRHGDTPVAHSASAFHTLPIPATSRWSRSASPTLARLVLAAQVPEHLFEVGRRGEDVRAELKPRIAVQLQHRAVPLERLPRSAAQDEPRTAHDALAATADPPAAAHAQVAAERHSAFEAEEEVLADGFHRLEHATVEPCADTGHGRPWMRRLDLQPLTHQDLQPARGPVQRVALGHGAEATGSA